MSWASYPDQEPNRLSLTRCDEGVPYPITPPTDRLEATGQGLSPHCSQSSRLVDGYEKDLVGTGSRVALRNKRILACVTHSKPPSMGTSEVHFERGIASLNLYYLIQIFVNSSNRNSFEFISGEVFFSVLLAQTKLTISWTLIVSSLINTEYYYEMNITNISSRNRKSMVIFGQDHREN